MSTSSSSVYPAIQHPTSSTGDNSGAVPGVLNYVDPSVTTAHCHRDVNGDDSPIEDCTWRPVELTVHNGRERKCNMDRQGCELIPSSKVDPTLDFRDSALVMDRYYSLCEQLLAERLSRGAGGNKVKVTAFDHNVRMATDPSITDRSMKNAGTSNVQVPLGMVHGDYTLVSGPRRLSDLAQPPKANDVWRTRLKEESLLNAQVVEEALAGKRRYALINVWRSIDTEHPVSSYPLAFGDSTTVSQQDLRTLQLHYTDRVGENYLVAPSSAHEWLYFPEMTFDEAMLIKQWDSHGDLARDDDDDKTQDDDASGGALSTFAIHSAFAPPPRDDARPRKSIEVRCVCIWEPDSNND